MLFECSGVQCNEFAMKPKQNISLFHLRAGIMELQTRHYKDKLWSSNDSSHPAGITLYSNHDDAEWLCVAGTGMSGSIW